MVRLLIIADDFTGALDCGVKLAEGGCGVKVVVGVPDSLPLDVDVLVLDTETRHLTPADAFETVRRLSRMAIEQGVGCIYKKTDSALRGNVGAELAALLDGSGEDVLPFFPAYPEMGRTVRGGVLYIGETPVADSVFGSDPFEPVKNSFVPDLIAGQADVPIHALPPLKDRGTLKGQRGILVFDASTPEDHEAAGRSLIENGGAPIMAGCAGFAMCLPRLLGLAGRTARGLPPLSRRLLVVCGSVNPITVEQIRHAVEHGFRRVGLTPAQKLERGHWEGPEGIAEIEDLRRELLRSDKLIIDTNDTPGGASTEEYAAAHGMDMEAVRTGVSGSLGRVVGELMDAPGLGTLFITGGDTLLQCMNVLGIREMEPLAELDTGIVLSRFRYRGCERTLISKSGGFGEKDLFTGLSRRLAKGLE